MLHSRAMPRKIFDVHMHFPRNWEDPTADPRPMVERLAETAVRVGIVRACMLTGGRFGPSYETGIEILQEFGDLFIPVAVIDPEEADADAVRWLYELGYRGLKLIGVARPYDEPDYLPTYAAAEELGMPILFHLGVIGGPVDYSITHPRRDAAAAQAFQRMLALQDRFPRRDVSAARMSPLHLDTLANRFPRLKIIGAHLGNQGNYQYVASVARWRHNVWFDMSGGTTIERHAMEWGLIGREIGIEKLVWGSDCAVEAIEEHVERFEAMFDQLELDDEARERLWWRNAAEIYGLEQPAWAQE